MDNVLDARDKKKGVCNEEQILSNIADATLLFQKGKAIKLL